MELRKQKKKVQKLVNQLKYASKDNVIGDLNNNVYVQFLPVLKGYHIIPELNNKICVFYLDNWDMRKKLICPVCDKDLSNEICGIKETKQSEIKENE